MGTVRSRGYHPVHLARRGVTPARLFLAVCLMGTAIRVAADVSPAAAACSLKPAIADVTVSQGLPHQQGTMPGVSGTPNNPPLVRGKTALVKLFLTAPAGASVQVNATGTSLAVKNSNSGQVLSSTIPLFNTPTASSTLTTLDDNPGDPVFVVPGSVLAADTSGITSGYPASFTASLNYTVTSATGPCTDTLTYTVSAPVAKKSGALRLLVVP